MISNKDKIGNVVKGGQEYFFIFNQKHKWSISFNDSENKVFLHLYPDENISLNDLTTITDWESYGDYITYRSEEFKSKEALETFLELYDIVKSKLFGAEDILDDILRLE
jgi:hypothetical protein